MQLLNLFNFEQLFISEIKEDFSKFEYAKEGLKRIRKKIIDIKLLLKIITSLQKNRFDMNLRFKTSKTKKVLNRAPYAKRRGRC